MSCNRVTVPGAGTAIPVVMAMSDKANSDLILSDPVVRDLLAGGEEVNVCVTNQTQDDEVPVKTQSDESRAAVE